MNQRQVKKKVAKWIKQRSARNAHREAMQAEIMAADAASFDAYAATPNGSARLIAFHDAVSDADDTLESVSIAILDGDLAEASRLIALGRESLQEHITELKGML